MTDEKKDQVEKSVVEESEELVNKTTVTKRNAILDTIPPPDGPPDKGGDEDGGQDSE